MLRRKQAAKVLDCLREIERQLACYHAGDEPDSVIKKLDEQIAELRDVLWHEMPRELARVMDREDGLSEGRGEWP